MNRPSRTEDDLEHPTWNQNPPFLAPDLTTCQDLNGIANAREQRNGGSGGANSAFGCMNDEKNCHVDNSDIDETRLTHKSPAMSGQLLIASKTALGGEGQACRSQPLVRPPSGWIGWIASVVVVSTIVHCAGRFLPALFSGAGRQALAVASAPPTWDAVETGSTLLKRSIISKRQSATCEANAISSADYNLPLHVGALIIILVVSGLACALPMIALRFPIVRIPERFFFAVRHFGTGVLLATAFVHLLPTAFISLGDPCLSSFWTKDYPAMPGAIALIGIFFVSIIEMVFSPARHFTPRRDKAGEQTTTEHGHRVRSTSFGGSHCNQTQVLAAITRPSNSQARRGSAIEPAPVAPAGGNNSVNASKESLGGHGEVESQGLGLTEEQQHKKAILQCMLLEVGILFHSVFIGMALSVAVGGDFVVLLIAVAFHQTFEGLALGARISSIKWPKKTMQPWFMVLAYGCTTPIGQAIGLATHQLYSPGSEFGLILVGTMNAISSGLLVFAALVELLAEDFLSDESWGVLRGRKRVAACLLVFFGAVCMSLVGAWA